MEKLEIKYLKREDITPYVNNTRIHPQEQIEQIKASINEFGVCNPIGLHNGSIVFGHGRYEAMKQLGYEEFPTLDLSHLTESQRKAYVIADNKIGDNSFFDEELLKIEIEDLQEMDFDIDLLGFSLDELENLDIGLDENLDIDTDKADEVPELEENPVIKLGDLIELNNHRLLCGDSTSEENIKKVLEGQRAVMVFTDPPYLIQTQGGCKGNIGKGLKKQDADIKFIADFNPMDFLKAIPQVFEKNYFNAYVFCNKDLLPDYLMWAKENKISFNPLIWKKPNAIPIGGSHRPDVEFLLLFRKSAKWNGALKDVNYSRVIEESRETGLHPTMKPVPLIENQMLISSDKRDIILDFFGGSGSTMIACENLDRQCRIIELSEQYAQVIIQRWCDYTSVDTIKINGVEVLWTEYKENNKVS